MPDQNGSAFRAATARTTGTARITGRAPGSAAAHDAPAGAGGSGPSPDPLTIGRRLRHIRRAQGKTLADVAGVAAISPSALSLIENGKREAKLTVLSALAAGLNTSLADLLAVAPPSRRAALEIELEKAQRAVGFQALNIPAVRPGPRLPTEALEALVGLHRALADVQAERAATPEHARRANAELRERMRRQDNYFGDIEQVAADLLTATKYQGGPITRTVVDRLAAHLGFRLVHISDLPESTRTVTDLANRIVYLPQPDAGQHDSRSLALQALGHVVLDHAVPDDYSEFLRQRVEINYFAASLLIPERGALALLRRAKAAKDIAIEDLRDAYAVSYETAAHRFTNLATRHLDLPVHFMRISSSGVIYKAYENDGVHFPTDATGAIEGQRVCRYWTARRGVRSAGPVGRVPAVHRHQVRDLLVHRRGGPDRGRHLLGERRRALRARQVDARPGVDGAVQLPLPRPGLLLAAARVPRPALGRAARGRARGRIRTCSPPCRRASSRASTRPTCSPSWSATRGA